MKRRNAIQALLGFPALAAAQTAVPAQSKSAAPNNQGPPVQEPAGSDLVKTPVAAADIVGPGTAKFFHPQQFAALHRLASIIAPSAEELPGADEAGVAEFLDFLLSESPQDRVKLYRNGLDRLNNDARQRYQKDFDGVTADQADALLAPLRTPWTYTGPSDPFAQFLQAAKQDVLTATANSRVYIQAVSARRRNAGGVGMYWYPIE